MRFLAAFLFLVSPLWGQTADIRGNLITAPDSVPVGRTFIAKLKGDYPYTVTNAVVELEAVDRRDGSIGLWITAADKPIVISVSYQVAHPTVNEIKTAPLDDKEKFLKEWLPSHNKDEIYQDSHTIQVGPPPPPPPPPGPDLTGLSKSVFERAKQVGNAEQAHKLSENYATAISSIAAGAYKSLDFTDARAKIISDLYEANHPVSQANPKWGEFFEWLAGEAKSLDEAGKLGTVDDIKAMLEKIQAGLKAVK